MSTFCYNKDKKKEREEIKMNTILIIILTIIAWQLVYTIVLNITGGDEVITDIVGGGIWLIPITIINKIFFQ
jgi:hypothetical protein